MIQADRIARVRIELEGIDPKVWRLVEVPLTTSLTGLHKVIQAVMLFDDGHLFQFDVGTTRYAISDPEWEDVRETVDAGTIQLGTLVERDIGSLSYTYDFGDNWQHTITIEAITNADPADYPRFIDGSRRAPPEDVGGFLASSSSSTRWPILAIQSARSFFDGTAVTSTRTILTCRRSPASATSPDAELKPPSQRSVGHCTSPPTISPDRSLS